MNSKNNYTKEVLNRLLDRFYENAVKLDSFEKISKLYCYMENEIENTKHNVKFKKGELTFIGGNYSLVEIEKENNPIVIEVPVSITTMEVKEQCRLSIYLKNISKELNVPVIVKIKDIDEDKMLILSRYSVYGQDGDQLLFINDNEVNVIKNRYGAKGNMSLVDYGEESLKK